MKVVFVMKEPGEVRLLGSVLRLLDRRGHHVHLAFQGIKTSESRVALADFAADCGGLTFGEAPAPEKSNWLYLTRALRYGIDYLRYLEPRYSDAPKLRENAEKQAPQTIRRLGRLASLLGSPGVIALRRLLQRLERAMPVPGNVRRWVQEQEPEVLLVTPLVGVGSSQADFLRAAKRLGIRTAYPLLSWDNLTTKGLVRDVPDLVLVWNEIQVGEAVELHGIPPEHIRVAGSWAWDHWFEWQPRRSREEFCREVGLRDDRPIVLYVGSSWWVIRDEVEFVRRWVEALRAHGGALVDAGILVRPHPMRRDAHWADANLDDVQAAVWPRLPEQLVDDAARQNFFESIYYADAVFGINTSAQIESAIVGRPVHTLVSDEYRDTQQGTLHFHYLQDEESGHLYVARTLDEHAAQLEESLAGREDGRTERFVRRFARPLGRDVAATPIFVEALEELAGQARPAQDPGPTLAPVTRLALRPFAALAARAAATGRVAKPATREHELRRAVRRIMREPTAAPVVAGPWLEDEIGELLYWIPFLRWALTTTFGLEERLTVVARRSSLPWYRGLGARVLPVGAPVPEAGAVLPAELVAAARSEFASQQPVVRVQQRVLDFAPLAATEPPAGLELPDNFVAARFSFGPGFPDTAQNREVAAAALKTIAATDTTVLLGSPDRPELLAGDDVQVIEQPGPELEVAVLARARAFLGSYGTSVYVASLLGVPSVAVYSQAHAVASQDLQLAGAFLGRTPFGRITTLRAEGSPTEAANRAAEILSSRALEPEPPAVTVESSR